MSGRVEYPDRFEFLPGIPPDDEGHFSPHTPWFKFGYDSGKIVPPGVIRCGGPEVENSHGSFDDLREWAEHAATAPEEYDEHWTDEPRFEVEYGINCGDPRECCDPWFITDDPGTASENAQVIREPHALTRTVTHIYGPWRPIDLEADK